MSIRLREYNQKLVEAFRAEKKRLESVLPEEVMIEHMGSSAVGIGGKNIIDILIGAENAAKMGAVREVLLKNGYFSGRDCHADRIFLATSKEETKEGDFHVHICVRNSETYSDMILLRDFLRSSPEEARKYELKKHELAKKARYDREKYKALKSKYVSKLLEKAKR